MPYLRGLRGSRFGEEIGPFFEIRLKRKRRKKGHSHKKRKVRVYYQSKAKTCLSCRASLADGDCMLGKPVHRILDNAHVIKFAPNEKCPKPITLLALGIELEKTRK